MKPATPKVRALLAKLQAMAERGLNGERDVALAKLTRLKSRYDLTAPDPNGPDLFAGVYRTASTAKLVMRFEAGNFDVASSVKWAIENTTGVQCLFRDGQLYAQSTSATAAKLRGIASTVAASFGQLWDQFKATPGVNPADRGNFMLGLYDGMMQEGRHNEPLPSRPRGKRSAKAKKRAVGQAVGLNIHPYTVALNLGRQIRFCVPLGDIAGELDRAVKGQLE